MMIQIYECLAILAMYIVFHAFISPGKVDFKYGKMVTKIVMVTLMKI